nr:MAG TPA: hypothetical protein [Caudoviricetes sp.]DAO65461.1 MAG TPA: hypothetical protein [Caudoviricetes sp.]
MFNIGNLHLTILNQDRNVFVSLDVRVKETS